MSKTDLEQMRKAATGQISGTLSEWPALKLALNNLGIFLPDTAKASEVKRICETWLNER